MYNQKDCCHLCNNLSSKFASFSRNSSVSNTPGMSINTNTPCCLQPCLHTEIPTSLHSKSTVLPLAHTHAQRKRMNTVLFSVIMK